MSESVTLDDQIPMTEEEKQLEKRLAFIDYLTDNGGSERFDFWKKDEGGGYLINELGKYLPDNDAAYHFGVQLREQNPDVIVKITTNVVRVTLPKSSNND